MKHVQKVSFHNVPEFLIKKKRKPIKSWGPSTVTSSCCSQKFSSKGYITSILLPKQVLIKNDSYLHHTFGVLHWTLRPI
uniref:Uncharacterized protein n=1 Tax=Arundo donax TaxID=35708 RepID=A0A0A9AT96_ARUDO